MRILASFLMYMQSVAITVVTSRVKINQSCKIISHFVRVFVFKKIDFKHPCFYAPMLYNHF